MSGPVSPPDPGTAAPRPGRLLSTDALATQELFQLRPGRAVSASRIRPDTLLLLFA